MSRRMLAVSAGLLVLAACEETMIVETTDDAGLPSPAQSACMSAVAEETGDGNVTVLSSDVSQAGALVVIGVGEQRAQWRCVAGVDGTVEEVTSLADEGFF